MRSLQDWEHKLRIEVEAGNVLLGQLPLGQPPYNHEDRDELGRLLAVRFSNDRSVHHNLGKIEEDVPLSLALFLVLHGIYGYEQGEYWPDPCQQLGLPYQANTTSALGRAFRRILGRYRLPTFAHIKGMQNLVPILAHGGIPNYSLDDFFRLLHTSMKESIIQVDAKSLIEEWDRNPEQSFLWIDKPVQRFILHGGAVATDFVEQCITLTTTKNPKSLAKLELPQRVIEAYEDWREQNIVTQITGPRIRLQRPILYIDPYGAGVSIELPSPFFPLDQGVESLHWEIEAGGHHFEVPTDRQRVAKGYEYEALQDLQAPVASSYTIFLRSPDDIFRTWTLQGLKDAQLLMFDPNTWAALGPDEYNRPGERWILYPRDGVLKIEGGQLTRQGPPQYGEWRQYRVEEWIIPAASTLKLCLPDRDPYHLAISNELSLRRPHLVDGKIVLGHHANPRFPLYSGDPPHLRIPFAKQPDEAQLERWQITIRPEGQAFPASSVTYSLNELTNHLKIEDDGSATLNLGASKLLGDQATGKFEIQAQGPFGQSRRLGLRIVPHLKILGDRKLYLDQTNADADLTIICDPTTNLLLRSEEDGIECTTPDIAPNYYKVRAAAHIHTLRFVIAARAGIRVPFSIRLRRLRWAFRKKQDEEELVWQTIPLRIYPDALKDAYSTDLYIELPPFIDEEKLYGGWRLIDSRDQVWSQRPPNTEHARRQYAIPLPELMSEYRQANAEGEILRLQVWVRDCTSQTSKEYFINAMYLLPTFELGTVRSEWLDTEEGVYLSLDWEKTARGQNRTLFLWPADEPWFEQPREITIPEDSIEDCLLLIPDLFGVSDYRGDYLAAIDIKNPWGAQTPKRPDLDQPNAFLIHPPHASAYYESLQEAVEEDDATAEQMLALLHYYHRTNAANKMHDINRKIRSAARQELLQLEQLVLWAELTRKIDKHAYKLAQRYSLFSVETMQELEQREIAENWRQRYFAHLPTDFTKQGEIYIHLLVAGFPEAYDKSLAGLCHLGKEAGVEQLLSDVESGRLLFRDAIKLLQPAADKIAPYLIQKETDDALRLLRLLAERSEKPINWLQPGFFVKTSIGWGQVDTLVAKDTDQPVACCHLDDPVLAHIKEEQTQRCPPFTIDLSSRKAIIEAEAYQCSHCQQLFRTQPLIIEHHDENHPYKSLAYRHLSEPGSKAPVGDLTVCAGEPRR